MNNINVSVPKIFQPLFNTERYKILYGGRASAKSTSANIYSLIKGMEKPIPILYCREFQNSIKDSVKSSLDNWIDNYKLNYFYRSTNTSIIGKNGTEFIFYGLKNNITKIKSLEGIKLCVVEEAENISERSWEILVPTIRDSGSEIIVIFNPYLDTDPTYVRFITNKVPDSVIIKANYYNNPFLSDVSKREIEYMKENDYNKYLHIYEGEPQDLSDNLVFNNWSVGKVRPPKDGIYYFGMDFGYATDPSTVIKCCIHDEERELHIFEEAHGYHIEIEDLPVLIRTVSGHEDNHIVADSSRPETISYLSRQGFYMLPSQKGPGSIMEGIEFIKNFKVVVDIKCKNTLYELAHYSYEVDARTGLIKPRAPKDKDNHLIDSLRYALSYNFNRTVPQFIC